MPSLWMLSRRESDRGLIDSGVKGCGEKAGTGY